ncbi:MAG TPA: bifunctional phosphoribosyl-AMP cyclohydrolase/phosphoribosyl-ATP diphosphatase HisIE [Pyrinomonadaceae bacterium]|jgi:phosphoribosyl-ATP pyrophosphohydrolase/phosphoribosyl-AMP cyclohydrolase|nr:bifunctional phosphoribosyl-AMP cyclohydrolase/phosphoribosyl-ATP diphosphatase HisIE [Pyrinomonadaceae bacterium]
MNIEIEDVKYDERGLVPAIVQDARTGEVLTLAYMNAESLRRTLAEGETWFWSRSRGELWHKGATSGNTQRVLEVRLDCDGDALVLLVEPAGPACHTGARSCFHNEVQGPRSKVQGQEAEVSSFKPQASSLKPQVSGPIDLGATLERLYALILNRREERPEGSYTTYLFDEGLDKILKKVGEEAAETIIAAKNEDAGLLVNEASDLIYHLVVLLVERGVTLADVRAELERRGGKQKKA